MGLKIGNQDLLAVKYGVHNITTIFLGNDKMWPIDSDIDPKELVLVLACICFGYWYDLLPWNDSVKWTDKII